MENSWKHNLHEILPTRYWIHILTATDDPNISTLKKMSEVVDLTGDDAGRKAEHNCSDGPPKQRVRTEVRPAKVFVVIHDQEPPGRYRSECMRKVNTEIVGIYYSYADACLAAGDYVLDKDMFDEDYSSDDCADDPFENTDWSGEGWFRQNYCDASGSDDRIRVEEHSVS